MDVKQILGSLCLAVAMALFVLMYLVPHHKRGSKRQNPRASEEKERLIRIEERTGLITPLQLALIGAVLLT